MSDPIAESGVERRESRVNANVISTRHSDATSRVSTQHSAPNTKHYPYGPDWDRVTLLVKRLRLTDPVRQAAKALLEGRQPATADLPVLLREVRKPSVGRWRECAVAGWVLGQMPLTPRQEMEVAQSLGAIVQGKRPGDFSANGCSRCVPMAALMSLAFSIAVFLDTAALAGGGGAIGIPNASLSLRIVIGSLLAIIVLCISFVPLMALLAPFVLPFSRIVDRRRMATAKVFAAQTLGLLRVPLSIGPLARAMRDADDRVRGTARQALRHILPILTPDHYGRLPPGALLSLCEALPDPEEAFMLEVLEALGKVGGGRTVQTVEAGAAWGATARIRELAARILPLLHERQQREKDASRLLRPSASPAQPAMSLVRPARHGEAAEEQLLRPSSVTEPPPSPPQGP